MAQYFLNVYSIPYFISFLVCIIIAGILLIKKRDSPYVQLAIIAQLSVGVMSFASALAACSLEPDVWYFWCSIIPFTSIFGITVLFHFSYISYSKDSVFENKKILMFYALPLLFLGLYILNPEHVVTRSPNTDLGLYGEQYTGIFSFFKPLFYSILGIMLFLTTMNYFKMFKRSSKPIQRKRATYFILSTLIPLIGFTISIILVEILHVIPHVQLGIVALSISGAVIAYGILKHQLFDIEFVVKETFIYLIITLILIGIFRLIELVLSTIISSTFFGGDLTARLVAAAIVAGTFFPLRNQTIKIGDKLFPKLTGSVKSGYKKNLAIYRRQLEFVLSDAKITKKERAMLKALRLDLGITEKDHSSLVKELTKKPKAQKKKGGGS